MTSPQEIKLVAIRIIPLFVALQSVWAGNVLLLDSTWKFGFLSTSLMSLIWAESALCSNKLESILTKRADFAAKCEATLADKIATWLSLILIAEALLLSTSMTRLENASFTVATSIALFLLSEANSKEKLDIKAKKELQYTI